MRKITEFIIWNHVFILYNIIYGYMIRTYIYSILGGTVLILSTLRHLHHEKKYNRIEPFVAKFCVCYNLSTSVYYLTFRQNMILLFIKCTLLFMWKIESYHYEYIHPWLHIIIFIDNHFYLSFLHQKLLLDEACKT